ncbi:MAG: prepilin-type N-terminal cleavage/methylation domain-containing protein [Candidatus Shapirobacteria bacterium]|nr:prepilin-type N-terminal cleavage/methylation domain-containing protein [Candidatus Shapirobacteria bacterium]
MKRGFTLVELVVSVTLILLLTGIGVTSFASLLKSRRVGTVKSEISTWVSLSRNLAITGQLPSKQLGLKFVRMTFTSNNFTAVGVREDGTVESPAFFVKSYSENLDSSDISVSVSNGGSFGFNKGSGRLVDTNGNFIDGPVVIDIESEGTTDSIRINDLGIIDGR